VSKTWRNLDELLRGINPAAVASGEAMVEMDTWKKGGPFGYKFGVASLDKNMRLFPGQLYILGGRTGMGKSAVAEHIAISVAMQLVEANDNGMVAYFSAEMLRQDLAHRYASMTTGIELNRVRMGRATDEEYIAYEAALRRFGALPIWIDDSREITVDYMEQRMRAVLQDFPVRFMVIDYLGLVMDNSTRLAEERLSNVTRKARAICGALQIPGLALAQLNRDSLVGKDKHPSLEHIRGSDAISHHSDVVILIHSDDYYLAQNEEIENPKTGVMEFLVAKGRSVPTGICVAGWDATRTKLYDIEIHRTELDY